MMSLNNELKEVITVAILGVGNIGCRHLQSLIKTNFSINIYLYDIDLKKVENVAREIELNDNNKKAKVFVINSLLDLPSKIFLCIVATTAISRLSTLIKVQSNIRFLVLEKVLTSSLDELKIYKNLACKYEKVYVNMPYYFQDIFAQMFDLIKNPKKIIFQGNDYGIACNFVHLLDIAEKLLSKKILISNKSESEILWKESSRKGFYDLTGKIKLVINTGEIIDIFSGKENKTDIQIKVLDNSNELIYDWETGDLSKNGFKVLNNQIPFQSERSIKILEDLLRNKAPQIASLEKAIRIHEILINVLQPSWNNYYEKNKNNNKGLTKNRMIIT